MPTSIEPQHQLHMSCILAGLSHQAQASRVPTSISSLVSGACSCAGLSPAAALRLPLPASPKLP